MNAVINLSEVSVKRGKNLVVDDLNLEIPRGKIVGLLGPSGAGKSTVMRVLMGVQSQVNGSVVVLGHEPTKALGFLDLEAARKLIEQYGPAGFSLTEAARLAGVSPAASNSSRRPFSVG